jgi:hypothetical protein
MTKPAHGLWIDDPARMVMSDPYWVLFRDLGFSVAALFLDSFTPGFDVRYTDAELAAIGERLRAADVELVITVCPEPRVEYIAQMRQRLPRIIRLCGAAALEYDAESNWMTKKVVGFRSLAEAAEAVDLVGREFQTQLDVRSELTTFTEHNENGPRATLADDVDRVVPQGYSVRNRKDAHGRPIEIPFTGHVYSPGAMQKRTFDKAMLIPKKNGKPAISCGLAAYDQLWPGKTVTQAMRIAYDESLRYSPKEVRWWSSKWVIGGQAKLPVTQFFRDLAREQATP